MVDKNINIGHLTGPENSTAQFIQQEHVNIVFVGDASGKRL